MSSNYRIRVRVDNEIHFRVKSIHSAGVMLSQNCCVPVSIKVDLLRNIKTNRQANYTGKVTYKAMLKKTTKPVLWKKAD